MNDDDGDLGPPFGSTEVPNVPINPFEAHNTYIDANSSIPVFDNYLEVNKDPFNAAASIVPYFTGSFGVNEDSFDPFDPYNTNESAPYSTESAQQVNEASIDSLNASTVAPYYPIIPDWVNDAPFNLSNANSSVPHFPENPEQANETVSNPSYTSPYPPNHSSDAHSSPLDATNILPYPEVSQARMNLLTNSTPFPLYTERIALLECTALTPHSTRVRALDWVRPRLTAAAPTLIYNHTSYGYIRDGNDARFLWLPRAWTHDSATIGWYVHSPFRYSEINWTTYVPFFEPLLMQWLARGEVRCVKQWGRESEPGEFRFFKGYFLAGTERDTRTLLNRATPEGSESEGEGEGKGVVKMGGDVVKKKRGVYEWLPVKQQMPAPQKPESPSKKKKGREDNVVESPSGRRTSEIVEIE